MRPATRATLLTGLAEKSCRGLGGGRPLPDAGDRPRVLRRAARRGRRGGPVPARARGVLPRAGRGGRARTCAAPSSWSGCAGSTPSTTTCTPRCAGRSEPTCRWALRLIAALVPVLVAAWTSGRGRELRGRAARRCRRRGSCRAAGAGRGVHDVCAVGRVRQPRLRRPRRRACGGGHRTPPSVPGGALGCDLRRPPRRFGGLAGDVRPDQPMVRGAGPAERGVVAALPR